MRQDGEHLAQVPVDHIFDREVAAPERHVVPAQQRRQLLAHVHLQMRAKVHILPVSEGHQSAQSAHQRRVDHALETASLERTLGERADGLADVELRHLVDLV